MSTETTDKPKSNAAIVTPYAIQDINDWKELFSDRLKCAPGSDEDRKIFNDAATAAVNESQYPPFKFVLVNTNFSVPPNQRRYLAANPPRWLAKVRRCLNWIDIQVTKLTRFRWFDGPPEADQTPPDERINSMVHTIMRSTPVSSDLDRS